jgi:hypothetical protein
LDDDLPVDPHAERKAMKFRALVLSLGIAVFVSPDLHAQNKLQLDDGANLTVGFLMQTMLLHNDSDLVDDRHEDEVKVRRARLRLRWDLSPHITTVFQTELVNDNLRDPDQPGVSGADMRLIDAYVTLKPAAFFQMLIGQHMAPASRQNTTAAGGPMTFDRPMQNHKTLTWGTRAIAGLQNRTVGYTSAGLKGDVDVRDLGLTLFGLHRISDHLSAKHYLGAYQGSDQATGRNKRITGRLQLNVFDTEPGFFNSATYYGGKKTLAVGASYDAQSKAAREFETGANVRYRYCTADLFAEHPVGPGSLTLEGAYNNLDLDGRGKLARRGSEYPLSATPARQAEGSGYYVQAGYFLPGILKLPGGLQPWALFERWDAGDDAGSYRAVRLGLSYAWKGHNANVKLAFERLTPKDANKPRTDTAGLGLYLLY